MQSLLLAGVIGFLGGVVVASAYLVACYLVGMFGGFAAIAYFRPHLIRLVIRRATNHFERMKGHWHLYKVTRVEPQPTLRVVGGEDEVEDIDYW